MTTDLHPVSAETPAALLDAAGHSNAWPFVEARNLAQRLTSTDKAKPVLFETGYGPSGLPHIGTFGEVVRTTMVRHAFTALTGRPTRLLAFSDDMDALRKVPDNVPNHDMLAAHLGRPLTSIPDPFGALRKLRRPQQRPAARLPRPVRLRLRVRQLDRSTTGAAGSTPCCGGFSPPTTTSSGSSCRRWGRSGGRPTARSCPCALRPAASCRRAWSPVTWTRERLSTRVKTDAGSRRR